MERTKQPNGVDMLAMLVKLLADQEGVKITYRIESKDYIGVKVT